MLLTAVVKILHFFFERIHDFCMPGHVGGQDQRDHPLSGERGTHQQRPGPPAAMRPAPLLAWSRRVPAPALCVCLRIDLLAFKIQKPRRERLGRLPGHRGGAGGWGASQLGARRFAGCVPEKRDAPDSGPRRGPMASPRAMQPLGCVIRDVVCLFQILSGVNDQFSKGIFSLLSNLYGNIYAYIAWECSNYGYG